MRAAVSLALVAACTQDGLVELATPVALDESYFRCNVQPVLSARCGFVACHGTDERPLRIFAEQKLRLGVEWVDYQTPLTPEEQAANFQAVRDFAARGPGDADLLAEKPLDAVAGGLFHGGKDQFGTDDVFLTRDDPGYRIMRAFIDGEVAADGCQLTEEVGP
jgi:hypothetical protein